MRKFLSAIWAVSSVIVLGAVPLGSSAQAKIHIEILKPIVVAKVNKATQRMVVTVNGKVAHTWKVSTGASSYETPRGTFRPYRMHKMWYSRKYNLAPMPHAVFYKGGYAVHATSATGRLGTPASHGCVRLAPSNAKRFYNLVKKYGRNRTEISVNGAFSWAAYRKRRRKFASVRRNKRVQSRRVQSRNVRTRARYAGNRRIARRTQRRTVRRGGFAYTSSYGYYRPNRRPYRYRGY